MKARQCNLYIASIWILCFLLYSTALIIGAQG